MNGHSPRLSHPPLGTQSISGTLAGAREHDGFPARRQSASVIGGATLHFEKLMGL